MVRPQPVATAIAAGLMGLSVAACTTAPRLDAPAAASLNARPTGFTTVVRSDALDEGYFTAHFTDTIGGITRASDGQIDLLALSGGGAGGAFGAGVLVGLTQMDQRPRFEVVTGVSTGALIAPFAFLGPEWDNRLTEAFRGGSASGLMKSRGLGVLFDPGVYSGEPLRDLVNTFVTDEMIQAVAKEAAGGRVLMVATTNLDREETTIWNMGAIAMEGGDKARRLFSDVLTASASVPGVFPPVMIDVTDGDQTFAEMHVDGGASTPFFVAPEIAMILDARPAALRGANVYVVINGQASTIPRTTSLNTVDIAARSFSAVMNHMTRTALVQTDAFARRNEMKFHFTFIPHAMNFRGSLAVDEENMRATFDFGARCAITGEVWVTPEIALERARVEEALMSPAIAACPGEGGKK